MARSQGNLTILVPDDEAEVEAMDMPARSGSVNKERAGSMIVTEKITMHRTKSNPHLAKSGKEFFPNATSDGEGSSGSSSGGSGIGGDGHREGSRSCSSSDDQEEENRTSPGATDASVMDLSHLLGRKIRSSLIAQWESKIQQEMQT